MTKAVVPIRPLPRGAVVGADDVETRYVASDAQDRPATRAMEEVVGRQVQVPLRAGEPIAAGMLQKPVLVQRREEIEVLARRGAIVIRDKARALDEGGLGDTISVERWNHPKTRFVARVTGVREVEVFVSGAAAARNAER
jgi:flagella basal body P-ring formation protein FlgA